MSESGPEHRASSGDLPTQSRTIQITGDSIDSRDLFVRTREITIGHRTEFYRLRLTAQNKLILTK